MGRKSVTNAAKQKEKRLQRKEEQHRIREAMAVVAEANKIENPLAEFGAFQKYNKNGITADIYYKTSSVLDQAEHDFVFNLIKKNMQLRYEQCSWGWHDGKKKDELFDEAAKYLIVKNPTDGAFVAFSHFRFDLDNGIEVLYCYEIQLESYVQRKGLGKFMIQILELMAWKNKMRKVVLTVLKNNPYSKFFRALGYEVDSSSPVEDEEESAPYEVLSKVNKRFPQPPTTSAPKSNKPATSNAVKAFCCPGHHHHH